MKDTMKAILKTKAEFNGLELLDVPVPVIGDDEVLVKMRKTAICGTDVHIYDWNEWAQRTIKTPMIIGHEFVGTVVEKGKNVKGIEIGTLVSGEGHVVCGICRDCLEGHKHLCKNTKGIGVNRTGIFAEYAAIPAENIWLCDDRIPEDVISCFDPLGNAVHTALSFNLLGEDVLITGAGPIGIMAVAIAKHAGAKNIVITDVNEYRLDMARQMGATKAVNVAKEKISDCYEELRITDGFGVGMEMSGARAGFSSLIDHMKNGGKVAVLGLVPNDTIVNWDKIIFGVLTIKGIYGREMFNTWFKMSDMLQSGLDISPIITHKFHYSEYQKGFEAMLSGQSGKVVLNWEE